MPGRKATLEVEEKALKCGIEYFSLEILSFLDWIFTNTLGVHVWHCTLWTIATPLLWTLWRVVPKSALCGSVVGNHTWEEGLRNHVTRIYREVTASDMWHSMDYKLKQNSFYNRWVEPFIQRNARWRHRWSDRQWQVVVDYNTTTIYNYHWLLRN